jgi:hypothetical protein
VPVNPPELDLADRFDVLVDPNAEPVDIDEALIEFVLHYLETIPAGASTADRSD